MRQRSPLAPLLVLTLLAVHGLASCTGAPVLRAPHVSRLTESGYAEIAWAPDGATVLAVGIPAAPSTQSNVFGIDIPSGDSLRVTLVPGQFSNLSWSPDGSQAAITVDFNTVSLIDLPGGSLSHLCSGEASVWLPNGQELLIYAGNLSLPATHQRELRFVDLEGNVRRVLPIGDLSTEVDDLEYVSALSLSEDATRLAFSIAVPQRGSNLHTSYIVDLASGSVAQFRPDERTGHLSWAPDSDNVAYIRFGVDDYVGEPVIADADGACILKPLLPDEISSFGWGPDGKEIAFVYYGAIYLLDVASAMLDAASGGDC